MEFSIAHEKRFQTRFLRSRKWQKAEKRASAISCCTGYELFSDALSYAKDVTTVFVKIAHERFAAELTVVRSVIESLRHLLLHVEMKDVGGALGRIVQIGANPKQKIIGHFQSPSLRFAQPVFADEVGSGYGTVFEIRHPQ